MSSRPMAERGRRRSPVATSRCRGRATHPSRASSAAGSPLNPPSDRPRRPSAATTPAERATNRPRLLVATHSAHKLAELRDLLRLERAELVSLDDLGITDDPDETGETFETNARIKARFGARRTALPTLADDSGIEVDALGGGPGVRTRRYAGPDATDADNNAKLLKALAGLQPERRGARYVG